MTTDAASHSTIAAAARGGDRGAAAGGAEGAAPPLVTMADSPSPAGDETARLARRDTAYRLRTRLWELSSLERVRHCGRYTHGGVGAPALRLSGGEGQRRAGLAGLQSCASVWSCPVCSRRIASERASELGQVVQAVADAGGAAALVTMTLRHNKSHSLRLCWDAVSYGWSKVTSGKGYLSEREQFGVIGWTRVVEITYSQTSGWHVHVHALVLLDEPTSPDMLAELASRWWSRWERGIGRRGFTAVADQGGLDCRAVDMGVGSAETVARYFGKLSREVVGQSTKQGRLGNRAPFQVLADGLATGNADDLEAWWSYEQVSRGRRQLTWSHGLREWAGVSRRTDEEVVEEDTGGETLLFIDPESWPLVREQMAGLLSAAEQGGTAGAQRWLNERGASWFPPPGREPGR